MQKYLANHSKLDNLLHMKAINFILSLFIRRREPVFGPRIFKQQTWLDKQVQESLHKRTFNLD